MCRDEREVCYPVSVIINSLGTQSIMFYITYMVENWYLKNCEFDFFAVRCALAQVRMHLRVQIYDGQN